MNVGSSSSGSGTHAIDGSSGGTSGSGSLGGNGNDGDVICEKSPFKSSLPGSRRIKLCDADDDGSKR